MNTDYTSIANALKTMLLTITDLQAVYISEKKSISLFPSATIQTVGHSDEFHDTAGNIRQFNFEIRLYYRTDVLEDAETILRDLTDQVIDTMEADISLGGTCQICRPTQATWEYADKEVPVRVVVITIEATARRVR